MYTSVVLVALSGWFAPAVPEPPSPRWLDDYGLACRQVAKERKPLAVFIGSGAAGWEKLSREGKIGKEAREALNSSYVCLYVDASSGEGKRLARSFDVPQGLGIVISDRSGEKQAFHHQGDLKGEDLEYYLKKYANPDLVIRTTETNPPERGTAQPYRTYYPPPFIPRGGFGGGGC